MSSRCWTSEFVFITNFWMFSLSKSCLVGVDVRCSGFMDAKSMKSLGLLPMAKSKGVSPFRETCVISPSLLCASTWKVWCVTEYSCPNSWTLCPRVPRGTFQTIGHPFQLDLAKECVVQQEIIQYCAFDRMPAYHEDDGKSCLHESPSDSSEMYPSTHEAWKMTSDGEVLLHGYAVTYEVAPSKTISNPKAWSPMFVEPSSKKIRSPNSSAHNPLTRDLFGLGFVEMQNGQVLTKCW